jgi:hypothetical protein
LTTLIGVAPASIVSFGFFSVERAVTAYWRSLKSFVANSFTNGYRDLESQGRMGGCPLPDGSWGREIYLTIFKYDGAEYRPTVIGEQCRKR